MVEEIGVDEEEINSLGTQIGSVLSLVLQNVLSNKIGAVIKQVKGQKVSGVIYVPLSWVGKTVVILSEKEQENENQSGNTSG